MLRGQIALLGGIGTLLVGSFCGCATLFEGNKSRNTPIEVLQRGDLPPLSNPRGVQPKDVDPELAFDVYEQIENGDGNLKWYFVAFDDDSLVFAVAKHREGMLARRSSDDRHIVQRIYRVDRAPELEQAFDVDGIIRSYETGFDGVKTGMEQWEVLEIMGYPPEARMFRRHTDFHYEGFSIRFVDDRVVDFFERYTYEEF